MKSTVIISSVDPPFANDYIGLDTSWRKERLEQHTIDFMALAGEKDFSVTRVEHHNARASLMEW